MEERAPRIHWMADRNKENNKEHLNQPITDEYSSPHLWDKREAKGMVFNWLCWLLTTSHWPVSCHTTSHVMLSTDLATFGAIYITHGSLWRCYQLIWLLLELFTAPMGPYGGVNAWRVLFPRHFVAPYHPQPTTPMSSLVVLVKNI